MPTGTHPTALGPHQLGFDGLSPAEVQVRTLDMIARSLNLGRTIAFVGSGISLAYDPHYPDWEKFTGHAQQDARAVIDKYVRRHGLLPHNFADADTDAVTDSDKYLLRLERCDEECRRVGGQPVMRTFRRQLADRFKQPRCSPPLAHDPIGLLMRRLGIRRFLTTNYDVEIERAFVRLLDCPPRPLGLDDKGDSQPRRRRSAVDPTPKFHTHIAQVAKALTRETSPFEALLQFALGTPEYALGVFHCHGIFSDWRSMIVTERDYQRVYLRDDPVHRAYREVMDLAFSANPVLFVGFSLKDLDLLQPLRKFVSEQRRDMPDRPLFALLERDTPDEELNRLLRVRYGVKAWFYPSATNRTIALCQALERIAGHWDAWWNGWQLKPSVRRPTFSTRPSGAMVHHYTVEPDDKRLPTNADDARIESALEALDGPPSPGGHRARTVLVLGRAGTGKGTLGLRLAERELAARLQYRKRFFATMHFTNEVLSTIEAATNYLLGDDTDAHGAGPWERFGIALRSGRHLVVLGGLERLLVSTSSADVREAPPALSEGYPLEMGRPASREVRRLLEVLANRSGAQESHVVLTSSVEPIVPELPFMRVLRLQGAGCEQLLKNHPAGHLHDVLSRLHYALRGHGYALATVLSALERVPEKERETWLERLVRRLTTVDLSRRAEIAIDATIAQFAGSLPPDQRAIALGTLQRFALFSTPVGIEEMVACWPLHAQARSASGIRTAVHTLAERRLILQIGTEAVERDAAAYLPARYTAHTLVRQYVLRSLGKRIGEIPGELSRLGLSAFSEEKSMPLLPPPRTASGHTLIVDAVENLLSSLEKQTARPATVVQSRRTRRLVRATFGLIRSRWSANSIPQQIHLLEATRSGTQLGHYHAYHCRLLRLVNFIREIQGDVGHVWFSEERHPTTPSTIATDDAMLYTDELSWLYSELGMVSYAQGMAPDAYAMFRMGQDINSQAEAGTRGPRWCQSELSLAGVHLEWANLPRARYHLDNALRGAVAISDEEMIARVLGFSGLLNHLSGNYHEAANLYGEAVQKLRTQNNRRGLSIFLRHLADLYRKQHRADAARQTVSESIVVAESGGHLDLIQYARVAEAHLRLSAGDATAQEVLEPALEFARAAGIPKLEADAMKVQGHIALANRETELAARLAIRCLGIAAAFGMRLRVTGALVLMGRVAAVRGDWDAARSILLAAITLGHEQGYQLQVEGADRELIRIASLSRGAARSSFASSPGATS